MTFTAQQLSLQEIQARHEKCRIALRQTLPQASGMLVFSRTNIYYLTGTRANGIFWLPLEGEPVLMVRKAVERCQLESPLQHIVPFKSYADLPPLCAQAQSPLGPCIGAEMQALSWSLAQMLQSRLANFTFVGIDSVLSKARFFKSPYEYQRIQKAAQLHHTALFKHLPQHIAPNMSEQQISHLLWKIFFSLGHGGMLRKEHHGAEIFLGTVAAGKNTLYPAAFMGSGPGMGEHAAVPHMGYAGSLWQKNQILALDTGFSYEGYHSHCAMTLGAGPHISDALQEAYASCAHILQQWGATLRLHTLCPEKLQQQAQQQAQDVVQNMAQSSVRPEDFTFSTHGVGLSLDEQLWPMPSACPNPPWQDHAVATVVLGVSVPVKDTACISLKALFEVQHKASCCLTPLPAVMPILTC